MRLPISLAPLAPVRLAVPAPRAICRSPTAEATATPEGHTVHRLAGAFRRHFVGHTVRASSPQGRFAEGAATLDGLRMEAAEAWGKHLFLRFAGPVWLRVHLGLYGMWRFAGPGLAGYGRGSRQQQDPEDGVPEPRGLVRLRLLTGHHAADLSGPTACELLSLMEKTAAEARLGPDPLRADADPERAWAAISRSRTAIGALLMRQDVVAGIGNIYRAELLFRAGIDPHRPGRDITRAEWDAMWDDLTVLLAAGVRAGRIVTTRPAHRSKPGDASYVAHRAGQPCRVCGDAVRAEDMAGRRLYWCAACQPACQSGRQPG